MTRQTLRGDGEVQVYSDDVGRYSAGVKAPMFDEKEVEKATINAMHSNTRPPRDFIRRLVSTLCVFVSLGSLSLMLGSPILRAGELDEVIDRIAPETKKWASVCRVIDGPDGPEFEWAHYRDSKDSVSFWPASTIKVYTAIAMLELTNELELPLQCGVIFESQRDGRWFIDSARSVQEMISEVFRRSSNEDYTLLLRGVGIDRINTHFLIPERGFPHSALMRGYVLHHPCLYKREDPQRITFVTPDGRQVQREHTWSGVSYSQQRGATVISETTGNCTSTFELTDCLRRLFYHDDISPQEQFRLSKTQRDFLIEGGDGWTGLRNRHAGAFAWDDAIEEVFPDAKHYHKGGQISNYTLDTAYIHDEKSGHRFFLTVAANSGNPETVREMAKAIAQQIVTQP